VTPLQFYSELYTAAKSLPYWCIASVTSTRGSTPRKCGAQLAVGFDANFAPALLIGSIGGGAAEAKVLRAAQSQVLAATGAVQTVEIDLSGAAEDLGTNIDGVCGGKMTVALVSGQAKALRLRAKQITAALRFGLRQHLDVGRLPALRPATSRSKDLVVLYPMPMVLIGGGGHCGQALATTLLTLGFQVAIVDERESFFGGAKQIGVETFADWPQALKRLGHYHAPGAAPGLLVLLSRSYAHDLAALNAVAARAISAPSAAPQFIGMMGSARRIRVVLAALDADAAAHVAPLLHAPVGLAIGAQTPGEIAISIAAQLISLCAKP
jgi:xanthine dehydrogenase accessory factor